MNRLFVTCFRDVTIHIIAVSRTLHSSNQNAFMVKKYRKRFVFKAKQLFLTMQYSVTTTSPLYLYKARHGLTYFLNCVNLEKLNVCINHKGHVHGKQSMMIIISSFLSCVPLLSQFRKTVRPCPALHK